MGSVELQMTGLLPICTIGGNMFLFKSRLSLMVRVNAVLNRTAVVDSDLRFDSLCGSHLQSQSELYLVR